MSRQAKSSITFLSFLLLLQDSALLLSFLQHLLTDVHSRPPHGRDPSSGSLPRPWALSRCHAGAESWALSWIGPQHDGPKPRASFLRSPYAPSGTLRVPTREHASDAQGTTQHSRAFLPLVNNVLTHCCVNKFEIAFVIFKNPCKSIYSQIKLCTTCMYIFSSCKILLAIQYVP